MCHLFAVSSSEPRTLAPFLETLAPFAETESPHGWGVAASSAERTTLAKEARSFAVALREGGFAVARAARASGDALLFHIRDASVGKHTMENTHPFRRRVLGRTFLFIHNGTVPAVKEWPLRRLEPGGETDSEHAFLWLLESLPPDKPLKLARWLADAGNRIRALGKFNFVLVEGDLVWAFADTALTWCERVETVPEAWSLEADARGAGGAGSAGGARRGRGAAARAPGAAGAARAGAAGAAPKRTVRSILIATCPFTADEGDVWHPMSPGTLLVARRGRVMEIIEKGGAE